MATINLTDLTNVNTITEQPDGTYKVTNNGVDSTAILDVLLYTLKENLDALFKSGNIRKEEYAQAYVALYQAILQIAKEIFLQKDLIPVQIEGAVKDNELKDKQKDLIDAQIAQLQEQTKNLTKDLELKDKDGLIKDEQKDLIANQILTEEAKKKVHLRQIVGFDDERDYKLYKQTLDAKVTNDSVNQSTAVKQPNIFGSWVNTVNSAGATAPVSIDGITKTILTKVGTKPIT